AIRPPGQLGRPARCWHKAAPARRSMGRLEGSEAASRSLLPRCRRELQVASRKQQGGLSPPALALGCCRGGAQSESLRNEVHRFTAGPDLQLLTRCRSEETKDGFADVPPTGPGLEDGSVRSHRVDSGEEGKDSSFLTTTTEEPAEFFDCDDAATPASTPDAVTSDSARSHPDAAAAQDTRAMWQMLHQFLARADGPPEKPEPAPCGLRRSSSVPTSCQVLQDPHRQASDISALLARGWERPEEVRRLRHELRRLQQRLGAAADHRWGITPGRGAPDLSPVQDRSARGGPRWGSPPR
ncbi:unnamed protein product, partial [Prorocentrum cordatum]